MTRSATLRGFVSWVLLLLLAAVFECASYSPPGKPVLKRCQSPEKETFTCWWEPAADDGEDTTYRLYYKKESTSGTFECPDYHTAGKNSCFFNKNHTSFWVDYCLTVIAFNAYGNTTSDEKQIDVADTVKPNPPENVTVQLELNEENPTVHVSWNPYNTGRKSGWITVKYQLQFKKEDNEWNIREAGIETHFSLYSVSPGKMYMVQVRCALDNSVWSEWTNTTFVKVPRSDPKQQHLWILVSFVSAIPFLAALCILFIKRKFIKQWLLPPVPGPKIKGVDVQLLKNGRSEEVTSSLLIHHGFPVMMPWNNQAEEYMIVCDDNLLLVEDRKSTNDMIISDDFHFEIDYMSFEKQGAEETIMDSPPDASESELVNTLNHVNIIETEKALFQPKVDAINVIKQVENSSYVDIQRPEPTQEVDKTLMDYSAVKEVNGDNILTLEKQSPLSNSKHINRHGEEEALPEDYTRVKEVNSDNMVLLQDPSTKNMGPHYTDCGNHSVTGKVGVCADFIDNGYVDNIPTLPVM